VEKVKKKEVEEVAREIFRKENSYIAVISSKGEEKKIKEIIGEI